MHWHATVLSGRSADTRPCIVVTFDSAKYVFGCAEGTSRAYAESRLRFARTRAIFCERTDVRRSGGLSGALRWSGEKIYNLIVALGMIMGAADSGIAKLDVVGPPTTEYMLSMMRNFLARYGVAFSCVRMKQATYIAIDLL
jgi:ribonuclease Z